MTLIEKFQAQIALGGSNITITDILTNVIDKAGRPWFKLATNKGEVLLHPEQSKTLLEILNTTSTLDSDWYIKAQTDSNGGTYQQLCRKRGTSPF